MASLSPEAERAIAAAGARAPRLEDIRERGVNVTICPPRTFSRDAGEGPGGAQALKEAARRAWNRQEKFKRAAERAAARKRAQARQAAGPVRDIAAERAAQAAAQEAAKVARKQRRLAALVAEGLTTDQIAERLGVTRGTVYRQLKAHGLTARPAPRGNSGTAAAQLRADFAAAVAEGLTVPQIRERFGLSDHAVRSRLRHHGLKAAPVPRPPRRVREKAPPRPHPRDTRPEGCDMTWAELAEAMTAPEIAETLGRSLRAVRAGLHKRGLSARPMPRIARAMSVSDDEWRALAAEMSVPEISEKLGLSRTCIWRRLHKLGLRARPGKRGGRRADAPPPAEFLPKPKAETPPAAHSTDKAAARREARAEKAREVVARDRRRFKATPVPTGRAGREASPEAQAEGRSIMAARVLDPADPATAGLRILKDGANNSKIGGDVLVGRLKGARIVTLSLEERASCPRSCALWARCYGNNDPHAIRWRHGEALLGRLGPELDTLCAAHPAVLVRLHYLGDFWSTGYVDWWWRQIYSRPTLHAFGFTAHPPESEIGAEVAAIREAFPGRFAIRHSGRSGAWGSVTFNAPLDRPRYGDLVVCPEQRDAMAGDARARHCGSCALCWQSDAPVAFVEH
ncbi:hypothetical protein LNKW23_18160 [Paralimibaculum aggregatum]|uniref:Helix-turn-helix domain-containing protein n=1 Tax=Paralimibaculum aggregatum TaxID=3036245 RepID=A0ABQ6LN31_9RHOB|nr:helix-turn-helix domain-containing protein [Limibaculum sp. NKW23]GMG82603.1 hypothetical protein LNKW23_18160 [Limibaculum sp. NKW23]